MFKVGDNPYGFVTGELVSRWNHRIEKRERDRIQEYGTDREIKIRSLIDTGILYFAAIAAVD